MAARTIRAAICLGGGLVMRPWVGVVAAWGVVAVIVAAVWVWERIRRPRELKPGDKVQAWAVPIRRWPTAEPSAYIHAAGIVCRSWRDPKTMVLWVEVETPGRYRLIQSEAEHWSLQR